MRSLAFPLSAFLLIAGAVIPAAAEDATRPTADQLIQRLTPKQPGIVTRGIKVEDSPAPGSETAAPTVDLTINFEFNSAKLTTDAALTLDNLGKALTDPRLTQYRFRLTGHTDGKGTDKYNQTLSERRAAAVRDYLISQDHVAPARLESVGRGRSELLDKEHPDAAINRRVQVTNLGE